MGRGRDPFPSPGSRQALGQGVDGAANPRTAWPGARRLFAPEKGGRGRAPGALCKPVGFGPGRIWGFFSHSFHFLAVGTAPRALGALPLRCLAPAGPSRRGRPGLRVVGGSGGLGVGRLGGLPTEDGDSGWWCGTGEWWPGRAPDPQRPRASAAAGFPGRRRRGWSRPPRRAGRPSLPGRQQVPAPGCPTAPASDGARGLLPRAQRSWGPLLQPARPGGGNAPRDSAVAPRAGKAGPVPRAAEGELRAPAS